MKNILLLHGAIGSAQQLAGLKEALSPHCNVQSINFPGHGGDKISGEFSIKHFAEEVRRFLLQQQLTDVHVFGYSMGGYVALYLQHHYPGTFKSIITLATKFQWTPDIAAREVKMLQPDVIEQKLPQFAEQLKQRHQPLDWKQVLTSTAMMLTQMGEDNPLAQDDYKQISCPTLIMLGDRDKMVPLEETTHTYKQLPLAQLAILPNTPHPIEQVDTAHVTHHILTFLSGQNS